MRKLTVTIAALMLACSESETSPTQLQIAFEPVPFETTLDYVTDLAFTPDDTGEFLAIDLFGGFEHARLEEEGAVSLISGRFDGVYADYDAGQLGLALDPDFVENGLFYVATNLATNHVQIRRYQLDRQSFERTRDSEAVILDLQVSRSPRWHNITSLGFEEDGVMWVLVGDKGLFEPAQDETNIVGSLIRIIPSREEGVGGYTTPEGAPKYSEEADPAVYTIGIRSPWKGVYYEGQWFFGDVGLDDVEEVNVIDAPGKNLGWPVVEGPCEDDVRETDPDCALYDDPVLYYGRSASEEFVQDDIEANPTNKRSVYVGWIYHPTENDPYRGRWDDVMVFGDGLVGFVRAATIEDLSVNWHAGHMTLPTAWGQAPDGFVYVTAYPTGPPDAPGEGEPTAFLHRVILAD